MRRRPTALLSRLARDRTTTFLAGNLFLNLLRLVSTVCLTRLLTPADFGAMGILASIQFVVVMLSDVGFFAYTVRAGDAGEDQRRMLDETWTLRLLRGIALSAIIAALAWPVAGLIDKPDLRWLIAIGGTQLAIEGLSSMAFATGARHGQIGRLALLDLLPAVVQIALSILLAWLLRSYWGILVAVLLASAFKAWLSYAIFPDSRRRFAPSVERARDLWSFGRYIAGASLTQIVIAQTDKLVFARIFSLHQFGLYSLATNLAALPQALVSNYSPRLLYPAFTRAAKGTGAALADCYYRTGLPMRLAYMFGAGGLIAAAPLLIHLLYGQRYLGAIPYLQLLACAVVFKLPVVGANDLILATGNSAHIFRLGLFRALWLIAAGALAFWLAGSWGLVAAVVSVEAASQLYCWVALHRIGVLRPLREIGFYAMVAAGYMVGAAVNAGGLRLLS